MMKVGLPTFMLIKRENPKHSMNDSTADCNSRHPGMPLKRNRPDPFLVHHRDCRNEQEEAQGQDPQVHDKRFSKDQKIGDFLKHPSHHNDCTLHAGMDGTGVGVGPRIVKFHRT